MGFPQQHPVTGEVQWAYNPGRLEDGYEHRRDETGFCGNCGARPDEAHYRLVKRPA